MAYSTSQAVRDLKSRGHSTTYNPRNLESDWYPAWNQVFMDMKSHLPHVFIYPQHFLWSRDSVDPLASPIRTAIQARLGDVDFTTEEIDDVDETLLHLTMDVDDADLDQALTMTDPIDGDTSFESTLTVPGSDLYLQPDFSFIHLNVKPLSAFHLNTPYGRHRAGRKILHECYFGICEVKPAPSRGLLAAATQALRNQLFERAFNQLAKYASFYFNIEGGLARDYLFLWACVGPFWCWASVSRGDVPAWDWNSTNKFPPPLDSDFPREAVLDYYLLFSRHFELCTPDSDLEINNLITNHFQPDSVHEQTPEQGSGDDMDEE